MPDQWRDDVVDAAQFFRRDCDSLAAFAARGFVFFLCSLGVIQMTAKWANVPLFAAVADIGRLPVLRAEIDKYSIRTDTMEKLTTQLSGGNQQKVILGRWTNRLMETKLLILDEPTKGIDVGTKAEIYQMVCDFAKEGKAVIFISSELTEVLNVSDNIIVMHNGHITGKVTRQEATEESVLALAMLD